MEPYLCSYVCAISAVFIHHMARIWGSNAVWGSMLHMIISQP